MFLQRILDHSGGRHLAAALLRTWLGLLILSCAILHASAGGLDLTPPNRWLVVASMDDVSKAIRMAQEYNKDHSRVVQFQSGDYAVVLGPYTTSGGGMSDFKSEHSGLDLPDGAYLASGAEFASTVWKADDPQNAGPTDGASGPTDSASDQIDNYLKEKGDGATPPDADASDEPDDADSDASGGKETADRPDKNTATFTLTNHDKYPMLVEFFSETRPDHVWPGNNQVYNLPSGATRTYPLTCQSGEKICYGAWRKNGDASRWGAGREGTDGCNDCCLTCGTGEGRIALSAGGAPRYAVTFTLTNKDSYGMQVEFFSKTRNNVWPGNNMVYNLGSGDTHSFSLACRRGEKICYGTWRTIGDLAYWGAGRDGNRGCSNCCLTCGQGDGRWALTAGSAPQYASHDNGNSAGSIINDLATGLALGLGVGAGIRAHTPQPTYHYHNTPAPVPHAPPRHNSGISGSPD
jgi:hypothetical protein